MSAVALSATIVGAIAGALAVVIAWKQLRRGSSAGGELAIARSASTPPHSGSPPGQSASTVATLTSGSEVLTDKFDLFVSYSHEDVAWVRLLVRSLMDRGFKVFMDELVLQPGDVLVHKLEEGIRNSMSGVVIFSAAFLRSHWVTEEYSAMLARAVERKLRFIPIIIGDAELPVFAANRVWIDFRDLTDADYARAVDRLSGALRSS